MTKGRPVNLILAFALPMMLGNILQQFYNLADASIVGKFLGPGALAAVGATSSVQFLILGFCFGTCGGFCVPIAQKYGAEDYSSMRRLLFNSAVLTGVIAAVVTTLCCILTPQILRILNTPADIWDDTYIYIFVIFLGIPPMLLYNLSAGILRAIGDSKTPFIVLAISAVLNIVLDTLCIAVFKWGCAGAALATVASQAMSGIMCVAVILKKYKFLHPDRDERTLSGMLCRNLLGVGIPMGLQFSITAIGSMVLQAANNGLGSMYSTAFTAATRIKAFAMCPFDAMASAVATFCSQNYGAGQAKRVEEGVRVGCIAATIYGAVAGLLLFSFGRTACMVFLPASETKILDAAALLLRLNSGLFIVLGLLNVCRTVVQSLGYSGRAVFSGVMEMFARSLIAIFLVSSYGFTAISIADPAAWLAADIYILPMCFFTLHNVRKTMKAKESAEALKVQPRKKCRRAALAH